MSRGEFQMVCGLWLAPDFSDAIAGRTEPPRVNHSQVDFAALHRALSDLFRYGPPVQIQVPNDTIDQVAVHVRQDGRSGRTIRCEDFGATLLRCAKRDASQIIDVGTVWAPLHALPDRGFAPPPVILPFVVTASDFEDAMIWMANSRPSLGLPMLDIMARMPGADQEVNRNGTLPTVFLQKLRAIFGLPYEPMSVLDRICMDEPPEDYGLS